MGCRRARPALEGSPAKALLDDRADLQSELETAESPLRFGLRLQIQACEMLLEQLQRRRNNPYAIY
jgi:hypothetical protein